MSYYCLDLFSTKGEFYWLKTEHQEYTNTMGKQAGGGPEYSASSAYDIQFADHPLTDHQTLDRLQRRGWENRYFCALCNRSLESSIHLFWECPFAKDVWSQVATWEGCSALRPEDGTSGRTTTQIIKGKLDGAASGTFKGQRSILMAVAWHIWLERNGCTFRGHTPCTRRVIDRVRSAPF